MRFSILAALALAGPLLVIAAPAGEAPAVAQDTSISSTCDDEFCDRREFFYADSSFNTDTVCDGFRSECYKRASSTVQLRATCRAHPDQGFVRFQCVELRNRGGAWSGTSEVGKEIGLKEVRQSDGRCDEIYQGLCVDDQAPTGTVQLQDPFLSQPAP
ncbi:hypothetical protein IE81DRAFT_325876 [Ceraceosorus guamensis]|uniref:Cyanovirin-N domain-containing protein n=1 Tax=Ceraceosorus guamensis TaxID=1522189 RepID=A0A316VSW3_9BASI|nr:hypothetical protein IE81DRAFT_325876 [Ceraceosorus guamensis]PWN40128.1 hypothetical protein IE81DRAFT_325876 [Ceraceosorus guamensis]